MVVDKMPVLGVIISSHIWPLGYWRAFH